MNELTVEAINKARSLLNASKIECKPMVLAGSEGQIKAWKEIYGDSCQYIIAEEMKDG